MNVQPPAREVFLISLRAFIFVNGTVPDPQRVQSLIDPADYLVAVDGGLAHLARLGLMPSVLIGDLDSASAEQVSEVERAGIQVLKYPVHKDDTDLELALSFTIQQGFERIRIVGALGGRLDMTLANISLLMLPGLSTLDVRLDDGIEEVLLIHPSQKGVTIEGEIDDRLSLLPWGGTAAGIWTDGLSYPLRGETLYPERSRGISNQFIAQSAKITLGSGLLVCIHTRHFERVE